MNITYLRSKYRKEIEIIREKVHRENTFINLSGIDEIIILLEKLNLKERSEIKDLYLQKLIDYAIKNCQKVNEGLIDESHIKKAFQDIYRIEFDLMRKIQSIERTGVSETEKQPVEVETLREVVDINTPEKQPEELEKFETIKEQEVISVQVKPLIQEETLIKEVVVSTPKEQPEELIPPEPVIINCPFCGLLKNETAIYCLQCGMIFKKK